MPTKSRKVLPKISGEILNGGVYRQFIRCGKASCKCISEPHQAFYFFTRRNGKMTKTYIRLSELTEFSKLVSQATEQRANFRRIKRENLKIFQEMRLNLQENDLFLRTLKGV